MARITVNLPESIVFENSEFADNPPTLSLQSGVWGDGPAVESGVTFDVSGTELPLLTAHDLRKLIKWLTNVADELDGKRAEKKHKGRSHYRDDEDDDFSNWRK